MRRFTRYTRPDDGLCMAFQFFSLTSQAFKYVFTHWDPFHIFQWVIYFLTLRLYYCKYCTVQLM